MTRENAWAFFVAPFSVTVLNMKQIQRLNAAFATCDREAVCEALLALILDADNVSAFALKAGVDRSMLYSTLRRNLRFDIVLKVLRAAALKVVVVNQSGPSPRQLYDAFETEEVSLIVSALSDALKGRRFTQYRIIRPPHVPRLGSVLSIFEALDLRMEVRKRI
jgi:DNA-binding phage protein